MKDLRDITAALSSLDELSPQAMAESFVEIRDNGQEVILGANRTGLLWLALQLVELANRDAQGAHLHLDLSSGADVADRRLSASRRRMGPNNSFTPKPLRGSAQFRR